MNGFDDLMALIALVGDPAGYQARLTELAAAIKTSDTREAEAVAAHAELEGERARLGQLDAKLREREVAVYVSEQKHAADIAAMTKWKLENSPSRLIAVGPSGLYKEPDLTENAPDPIDDMLADEMGLESIGPGAAMVGHRKTLRRIRV